MYIYIQSKYKYIEMDEPNLGKIRSKVKHCIYVPSSRVGIQKDTFVMKGDGYKLQYTLALSMIFKATYN